MVRNIVSVLDIKTFLRDAVDHDRPRCAGKDDGQVPYRSFMISYIS